MGEPLLIFCVRLCMCVQRTFYLEISVNIVWPTGFRRRVSSFGLKGPNNRTNFTFVGQRDKSEY